MICWWDATKKKKRKREKKQQIQAQSLQYYRINTKDCGEHINFRHQAEKGQNTPSQKGLYEKKEQKENAHHFQKGQEM